MSQVTYTCAYPACTFTQETRSKLASTAEPAAERVAHATTAHDVERGFYVSEKWSWLTTLTVLNIVTLILSAVALFGDDNLILLGMLFPQLWGWTILPGVGVVTVLVVAIGAVSYAVSGPKGASFARRLYAGVTMSAFIVALLFPVGTLLFLAYLNAAFSA